jgi:hypothetical protein
VGGDQAAALRTFLGKYPTGRYSLDARNALSELDYEAVKNSSDPNELRKFALEHPDQQLARAASRRASQLETAAADIGETLKRYAAAIRQKNIDQVSMLRDLDKQQQQTLKQTFRDNRRIDVNIIPTSAPSFEPGTAESAMPSQATIEIMQTMQMDTGTGDTSPPKPKELTVHLRRTQRGWIITDLR